MTEESGSIYMQQAPAPDPDGGRPDQGPVTTDSQGNLSYPSAEIAGMIRIQIPLKNPEPFKETESILACNFGLHVTHRVEAEFQKLKGIQYRGFKPSDPVTTLAHYAGAARGLELLEEKTISQLESLSRKMSSSSDPEKFFKETVRPFLINLRPGRR